MAEASRAVDSTRPSSTLPTCQIGLSRDMTTPMINRS